MLLMGPEIDCFTDVLDYCLDPGESLSSLGEGLCSLSAFLDFFPVIYGFQELRISHCDLWFYYCRLCWFQWVHLCVGPSGWHLSHCGTM